MRKHFVTGLIVLFPAILTIALVMMVANILSRPFVGLIENFLKTTLFSGASTHWLQFLGPLSKIISLALLFLITLIVGVLGRIYVLSYLGKIGEYILENIPIVNKIYRAAREVVKTLFKEGDTKQDFSRVVLVPYPYPDTLSIGLIPNEFLPEGSDKEHEGLLPVFVPGSPNPTMGFMLLFNREDVKFIDMTVEDALHMIISLGVIWNKNKNPNSN